jgi:hypothetical protein
MEKKTGETLILEIPIGGPVPSMISEDKYKTEMFKWLDDKPCLYGCFGFNGNYVFIINGMDYVVREWVEKYIVTIPEMDMTVDEYIEKFKMIRY